MTKDYTPNNLIFTDHAAERVMERNISIMGISLALTYGKVEFQKDGSAVITLTNKRLRQIPARLRVGEKHLLGIRVVLQANKIITVYRHNINVMEEKVNIIKRSGARKKSYALWCAQRKEDQKIIHYFTAFA